MKKCNKKKAKGKGKSKRFSVRASLIAIGQFAKQWKFFDVIKEKVTIGQKVVKHTPIEKLTDAFVCILAGARGLYEVNPTSATIFYEVKLFWSIFSPIPSH